MNIFLKKQFIRLLSFWVLFIGLTATYAKNSFEVKTNKLPSWFVNDSLYPNSIPLTEDERRAILKTSRADNLPSRVMHVNSKYMPKPFMQSGGSCGYAAGIGYVFSYETNNYRNEPYTGLHEMFPSHFGFNLYRQGSNAFDIQLFTGIPKADIYGGKTVSKIYGTGKNYGWMQGYDKWKSAMFNRSLPRIAMKLENEEDLLIAKKWMYDHFGDSSFNEGGVINAGMGISGITKVKIPAGEYEAGKWIITKFKGGIDHGVTFAGYDDSVCFDFNGDGKYTNDIDLDSNGIINIRDREIGALVMLNTWGGGWANGGWIYIPYRFIGWPGKYLKGWCSAPRVRKDYRPTTVLKIKMDYSERCNLRLKIGVSGDTSAISPASSEICHHFNFAGGQKIPMLGHYKSDDSMHTEPMEFGIDLGNLSDKLFGIDTRKPFKYFFTIETKDSSAGTGTLYDLSVIEYSYKEDGLDASYDSVITKSSMSNIKIPSGKQQIHIPILMNGNPDNVPKYLYVPYTETSIESVGGEEKTAKNIIDNDLKTKWLLWKELPQEIVIKIDKEYAVSGLEYYTRTDGNKYGQVKDYEIFISEDGDNWGSAVVTSSWTRDSKAQRKLFNPVKGRYLKLRALSTFGNHKAVSMREMKIIYTPKDATGSISNLAVPNLVEPAVKCLNTTNRVLFRLAPNVKNLSACEIYNIQGKIVKIIAPNKLNGVISYTLNKKDFAKQVYIIKIKLDNSSFARRFLIN